MRLSVFIDLLWSLALVAPLLMLLLVKRASSIGANYLVNALRKLADLPRPLKSVQHMKYEATAGICPVCAQKITSRNLVICKKCLTPHHRECFRWNHKCGLYACGSSRFNYPTNKVSLG